MGRRWEEEAKQLRPERHCCACAKPRTTSRDQRAGVSDDGLGARYLMGDDVAMAEPRAGWDLGRGAVPSEAGF